MEATYKIGYSSKKKKKKIRIQILYFVRGPYIIRLYRRQPKHLDKI